MEITGKTKLFEVLEKYPQLEEQIIQAAPAFKNLTNPILRKTVGKLASIEKVAQVGELDMFTFVNLLRRSVDQTEVVPTIEPDPLVPSIQQDAGNPDWVNGEPEFIVDGTSLLAKGEVPLHFINEYLSQLSPGKHILLQTDFEPQPMIDAVKKTNRKFFHKRDPDDSSKHLTYFQ